MDRLTGLDASFLYLETPAQLMHVCGLVVVDPATIPGGYDYASFKAMLAERIAGVPQFTRKLRNVPLSLDHPIWERDRDFHIDRHVHRLALPGPGGYAELTELLGHLAGLKLNRDHPLWDMHIIEGYGEHLAVFFKIHHSSVDGVSGTSLMSHLCSLEPDLPPIVEAAPTAHQRKLSDVELLGRAVAANLTKPLTAVRLLNPSLQMVGKTLLRAREGTAMAAPLTAPRTSFNGTITHHRTIAYAHLDLADIKTIKNATSTTVNDVVLTLAGGVFRSYLEDRGELPEQTLLATIPVSVRENSHRSAGANKVSALFSKLGTDIEDPLERLYFLHEANFNAKEHQKAVPADALQDWAQFAAPRTFGLAVRAYAALKLAEKHPVVHNLVISNVPGPQVPLYFAGGRVLGLFPLGPVFHGAGVNLTVFSIDGRVDVGVITATEALADADDLVQRFPAELARLKAAVEAVKGGRRSSGGARVPTDFDHSPVPGARRRTSQAGKATRAALGGASSSKAAR